MVRGQPRKRVRIELAAGRNKKLPNLQEIIYTTLRNRHCWQLDNCYGMYIPFEDYNKIAVSIIAKIHISRNPNINNAIDIMRNELEKIEDKLKQTALLYKAEYGM